MNRSQVVLQRGDGATQAAREAADLLNPLPGTEHGFATVVVGVVLSQELVKS